MQTGGPASGRGGRFNRERGSPEMTQLVKRRETDEPKAAVEIDNRERLIRLGYFVAIILVLAIVTGFSPFLGVLWTAIGVPRPTTKIGTIFGAGAKGGDLSPAQKAGFKRSDQVLAVDGHVVHSWDEISPYVKSHADKPVEFIVQRGDHLVKL